MAVDISTSTRGLVLSQEALAISTICHQLSKEAVKIGHLLPWSEKAHRVLRLTDSAQLTPRFGTDPTVLCSDNAYATALKESELWFLMTDGLIRETDIKKFADGITRKKLHGTACVIILFGHLPDKPWSLNISVGISVFAMTQNCLFLFHDVDSGKIHVLQHKGCFTTTFEGIWAANRSLDAYTTWESLSLTTYKQLAILRIPKPAKLGKDDIALTGGNVIKIQDLYQGRLNPQAVPQIFENDDNMKTILLTAAIQGKTPEVEAWLAKQKMTAPDRFTEPRPDIDGEAYTCAKKLIALMESKDPQVDMKNLQDRLRQAHNTNWITLCDSVEHRLAKTKTRNILVKDFIRRSSSAKDNSLSSLANLSPVSSICEADVKPSQRYYPSHQPATTLPYLYTPNYRRITSPSLEPRISGFCCLCGNFTSPLALLLKKADPNLRTEGFPSPGSRSRLAFPLAMGNFPETDIISTFVCCDPCSYVVTRIGEAPADEKIVGYVILHNFDENQHLWISALDTALDQRFAKKDLGLLFLAMLYTTLSDIDSEINQPEPVIREAIYWAIDRLERTVQAPMSLSQSLAAPGEDVTYGEFFRVLEKSFLQVSMPRPPILRYPIEGFSILVRVVQNMKNLEQKFIDNVVIERLLFHLNEQFIALRKVASPANHTVSDNTSGSKSITVFLPIITKFRIQNGQEDQPKAATPVTVASLCGGPLLSEEELTVFQTMMPSLLRLEEPEAGNIDKFIRKMVQVSEEIDDPVKSFDLIRSSLDSQ